MNIAERLVYWYDQNLRDGPMNLLRDSIRPLVEDARRSACGSLRKSDLVHGEYYEGQCRFGDVARWNAELKVFIVNDYTYGKYTFEYLRHTDDEVAECTHREGFRPSDVLYHKIDRSKLNYPLEIENASKPT